MRKLLIFFTLFIFSSISYSGDEVEKFVLEQHNKIFNYINASKDLLKNDKDKFLIGLEKSLQGLIISKEISKRVLGKKNFKIVQKDVNEALILLEEALKGDDEQEIDDKTKALEKATALRDQRLEDFDLKFKNTLFDTYSTALVEIDNTNIVIDEHSHPRERLDLAIVKMSVNVSDSDFDLIYKMKKINNKWSVIGIILDGIDLIAIFRKQFNKLLEDSEGNFDLAIQNWELES
jgi:ABC-type transporter MlaC component